MNKEEINYILETLRFKSSIYRYQYNRNCVFNDDDYYSNVLNAYIEELQQRIERAIEIIESYNLGKYDYSIPPIGIIELLETLKGEEK